MPAVQAPSVIRAEYRLQAALQDLRCNRPAAEVAQRRGYADQAHLCRAVKVATGQSVGELKKSDLFKTPTDTIH